MEERDDQVANDRAPEGIGDQPGQVGPAIDELSPECGARDLDIEAQSQGGGKPRPYYTLQGCTGLFERETQSQGGGKPRPYYTLQGCTGLFERETQHVTISNFRPDTIKMDST